MESAQNKMGKLTIKHLDSSIILRPVGFYHSRNLPEILSQVMVTATVLVVPESLKDFPRIFWESLFWPQSNIFSDDSVGTLKNQFPTRLVGMIGSSVSILTLIGSFVSMMETWWSDDCRQVKDNWTSSANRKSR